MTAPDIRALSSLRYVPGLDGLRAIAVTMVMVFHFTSPFAGTLPQLGDVWRWWVGATKMGWMGVDLFFVLSGFLITRVLQVHPVEDAAGYRHFVARRAWRLLPAYFACLAIAMLVLWALSPASPVLRSQWLLWTFTVPFAKQMGVAAAFLDDTVNLTHFWTLSVEWHFYLLFPFLLRAVRSPLVAGAVLIAVAIAVRLLFAAQGDTGGAMYVFSFARLDAFGLGCLVAATRGPAGRGARNAALFAGVGLVLAISIAVGMEPRWFKTLSWMQAWGYTAIALGAALVLYAVVHAPREGALVQLLERPWMRTWGRASYSAYLWHLVFHPCVLAWAARTVLDVRAQYALATIASTAFTIVAALASYRVLEVRFLARRTAP